MKKIPIQVIETNLQFMNENGLSFAKVMNAAIESIKTHAENIKGNPADDQLISKFKSRPSK